MIVMNVQNYKIIWKTLKVKSHFIHSMCELKLKLSFSSYLRKKRKAYLVELFQCEKTLEWL